MKDIGSTNLVPGTRTRSDNTMHVRRLDIGSRCNQQELNCLCTWLLLKRVNRQQRCGMAPCSTLV